MNTGRSTSLNCPHCGEPVPLSLWGFNPFTKVLLCRSCSRPARFPTHARVWGVGAFLLICSVEMLVLKDLGLWDPQDLSGIVLKAGLFLFIIFSSSLAGSFVCRRFSTALLP